MCAHACVYAAHVIGTVCGSGAARQWLQWCDRRPTRWPCSNIATIGCGGEVCYDDDDDDYNNDDATTTTTSAVVVVANGAWCLVPGALLL